VQSYDCCHSEAAPGHEERQKHSLPRFVSAAEHLTFPLHSKPNVHTERSAVAILNLLETKRFLNTI
jgi:hypothetical protein